MLLLVLAIVIAFIFQYSVASAIINFDTVDNVLTKAWLDGCADFETSDLIESCAGNAGVYRSSFAAFLFYVFAGIAVIFKRTANREAWPAKYILFLFLVIGMCFIPNEPLFLSIYLNVARGGAVAYIILEQIIFVDIAYNWNDSWVEKSNVAEQEEAGSGRKWLFAILASAFFLFFASIVGWVLLFVNFNGCSTNTAFIAATIVLCILITLAQLSGEEGSLLSSATITAYATMLCYSAVTKNDNKECNPFLGEDDVLGIIIGVGLTLVTLGYAGWSATADKKLSGKRELSNESPSTTVTETGESAKVTGIITNDYGTGGDEEDNNSESAETIPNDFSNSWKLNFVLAIVSCWFGVSLTGWGSIQSGGDVADPLVGQTSMWMIISTQWFVMTLYLWTLIAPRLFPDRDFS